MAVLYDPAAHSLLSTEAAALGTEQLAGWAEAAERALGLKGTSFTDDDEDTAVLAVVFWINCQLKHRDGRITAESKGSQSRSFSERAGDTDCERAWAMVRQLGLSPLGEFQGAGSLR